MTKCCKTCRFLRVPTNAAGKRVVRKDSTFGCTAPEPELPPLPASITSAYGFKWPPHRSWMTGEQGTECPTWEPLT